jgi:Co/Zn/Cd efflux system component
VKEILKMLYDNYFLTILIVLAGLGLFVVVTLKVFFDPVEIPAGTTAAYGTFFGIFATIVGLWRWRRDRDSKRE